MKTHERTAMINCNKCKVDKEETEFYSKGKVCKECVRARQRIFNKTYYQENKDKVLADNKAYYHANKEAHHALTKRWRAENPDRAKEICSNNYQQNKDSILSRTKQYYYDNKETYTQYKQQWRNNNGERISQTVKAYRTKNLFVVRVKDAINAARRRSLKTQATPLWANFQAIENIYLMCQQKTMETGVEHHVDHIVPLKGSKVSGLHVENNLRIITSSENCRKSNKHIEEIV